MENLEESQSRCVFVNTSLGTHIVSLLYNDDTSSDFKEKLREEHKQCHPQIGEIEISALKRNDENGEADQDVPREEGVVGNAKTTRNKKRKVEQQKKSCKYQKAEKIDDVSVPRKKQEFVGETSLSSSVLVHNNVAQGVASLVTRDLPRCTCQSLITRKLVVLDLKGILADVVEDYNGQLIPDGKISGRSVFKRPFVASFLEFCFERFEVGIWSSGDVGLDFMNYVVIGKRAKNLLFCFDQHMCTPTRFNTLEKSTEPLFLKDLRKVWERIGTCVSCGKVKYDESNTLLVDDSPHKALCNPPHTGIFPFPYQYTDRNDSALSCELMQYMERLAEVDNVQKFVAENPIGQAAINDKHESWQFYSQVIEEYK
ncbi:uncharacterized FCP1 homology domain-containing protein C1271.03c isoform X2 [Eutrema salsugineum]|uniref:uncharacterized FCP1 homology domain-containing protein C1271.03c isoform X2 n=1 Tax=Eutrema salsugineum TaxID=72664 RepID=UPI000CED7E1C|nr:uncharacterized FCP1 homology domain-containing protein C1271.03c isoform X2 [Eutrema salsugineum]